MRVPLPTDIIIRDYEIGHALMNSVTSKFGGEDGIYIVAHTQGYKLDISDEFRKNHYEDAVLAEAGNILMKRGFMEQMRAGV